MERNRKINGLMLDMGLNNDESCCSECLIMFYKGEDTVLNFHDFSS